VARATTGDWGKYYRAAEEKRSLQGGDPLKQHLERHLKREQFLFAGSGLVLVGLVAAFCAVLMR
jgi:hypothetical protein